MIQDAHRISVQLYTQTSQSDSISNDKNFTTQILATLDLNSLISINFMILTKELQLCLFLSPYLSLIICGEEIGVLANPVIECFFHKHGRFIGISCL